MPSPRQIIVDNLARVRQRMAQAALLAGRRPGEIKLVAVVKYVDNQAAAELLAAGCADLAESRPQQLWAKAADPELAGADWHLVGRLQTNKVRRTLPLAALIHSVDSIRLLTAIDEVAGLLNLAPRVLLEVNCSGEPAKQGFTPEGLRAAAEALAACAHVNICGLMTMAPLSGGEPAARRAFHSLRALRDELQRQSPTSATLAELSMGMSQDFEAAIAEGATMVRIGSLLFEGLL